MSSVPFSKKQSSIYFQDTTLMFFCPPSGCLFCLLLWLLIVCLHLIYWCSLGLPLFSLCGPCLEDHIHSYSLTHSLNTEGTQICTSYNLILIQTPITYQTCNLGCTTHVSHSTYRKIRNFSVNGTNMYPTVSLSALMPPFLYFICLINHQFLFILPPEYLPNIPPLSNTSISLHS